MGDGDEDDDGEPLFAMAEAMPEMAMMKRGGAVEEKAAHAA